MFSSGGGGFGGLPRVSDPLEILILLLIMAVLVWLGFRFFGDS
jgi:hypothetical protein